MINLLLGRPRSGKSYESVAFHVLPALREGRKIITNLPLKLDHFKLVFGEDVINDLIEIKNPTKEIRHRFSVLSDYETDWSHPETGIGPLFVIDECHFAIRRGKTAQDVEEWYSMHGHQNIDVLLMTQSYGKMDRNILEMVQLMYRVSKMTAMGMENRYVRKVYDGFKGAEVNQDTRVYESQYFPFYKSHTLSNSTEEASARDVKSIWSHWTFKASAFTFLAAFSFIAFSLSSNDEKSLISPPVEPELTNFQKLDADFNRPRVLDVEHSGLEAPADDLDVKKSIVPRVLNTKIIPDGQPYSGFTIAVVGYYKVSDVTKYLFLALQGGQPIFEIDQSSIESAGYSVKPLNDCAAILKYQEIEFNVTCQVPKITIAVAG